MGAAHGGYLTLETAEGERIRVERREGASASAGRTRAPGGGNVRVTLASGAQGGAELLQPLLGGITGELFRSLFAFSLSELQEVRTLQSDALSGYLYSAGLGARGDTIMAAERKLSLELEQLFRPRGRNQELNQTLQKLDEQESDIRRSKEQAGRYNDYLAELAHLDERIGAEEASVRELRSGLAWLEAAEQARSHWLRANEIRNLLMKLPKFAQFPEDAITRFNDLVKDKDQLWSERDKHQLAKQRLLNEIEALQADPNILRHQTELEGLYDQLTAYRLDQTTAAELRLEIEQQQLQLDRLLRQVAVDWTESILKKYAVTVVDREQARQWDDKIDKLRHEREQLETDLQRLTQQAEEAMEKANKLESKLLYKQRLVYDDITLEAQYEMDALISFVPQLRKQMQQKQQLQQELRHLEQREQDYNSLTPNGQGLETNNSDILFVRNALRWFCIVVNVVLPLYFFWNEQRIGALLSFILILAVTLGVWFSSAKPKNASRPLLGFPAENRQRISLQAEKEQLEQKLTVHEQSLSQRLQQLVGIAQAASTGSIGSQMSIQALATSVNPLSDQHAEESLELLQQAAEAWQENKRAIALDELMWQEAADVLDKQQRLKKLAEAKRDDWVKKLTEATDGWQVWLVQRQLTPELSPTGTLEIFQIIESAQHQLQLKARNETRREIAEGSMAEFEQHAQYLLGAITAEDLPAALRQWKEAADLTVQALQNQNRLARQLEQSESELLVLAESLERIHHRIDDLWTEAGAADEQQFRLHARQYHERVVNEDELLQLEATLELFIGSNRNDQLENLLLKLTPQELAQKITESGEALQQMEKQVDQLKENRGKLRNELEKLEQGAEHSERLQQMQERTAVLTEQAGQWAKTAFCAALFRKARELYERERQPGVLQLATDYFQKITAGEYVRVLVPFGEKKIVVEHSSGRMMDSANLSRGTAEQLYLSMRFALAEEYARKASLPLILDDILVNFDQQRMEQTIALLAQISIKHQVIFFTCHRHVAEAFSMQLPAHQQIHLL
jgi:uncharacterized protein YhaN